MSNHTNSASERPAPMLESWEDLIGIGAWCSDEEEPPGCDRLAEASSECVYLAGKRTPAVIEESLKNSKFATSSPFRRTSFGTALYARCKPYVDLFLQKKGHGEEKYLDFLCSIIKSAARSYQRMGPWCLPSRPILDKARPMQARYA